MSQSIVVDFSFPFQTEAPPHAPEPQSGIIVRWGDRDEFIPDSEEDDWLTDAQGAAL